jgi:CheY-like chemotaxis protein
MPQPLAEGRSVPAAVPSFSGMALVVDDEAPIRDVVSRVVRRMGMTVVEAHDGAHGLAQFRKHAHEISIVLLDLTMPGMGGGEVLKALRTSHPSLPVIVVSGYDRDDALAQIGDDPAPHYLAKPFGAGALRDQIVEIMHH